MDNIPKEETDKYTSSFNKLTDVFSRYMPVNSKVKLLLVRDLYSPEEFEKELKKLIPEDINVVWDAQTEEKKKRRMKMSGLNIKMDGKEDWASLPQKEQEQIIKRGSVYHDAYISLPKRMDLVKGPDKIIIFPFALSGDPIPCIPVGSTRASVTKCWTGMGILLEKDSEFVELILSPAQIEKIKDVKYKEYPVDLIDLKNLKKIRIYDQKLDFSQKT